MILRSKTENRTWLVQEDRDASPESLKIVANQDEDGTIVSLSTTSTMTLNESMIDDLIDALDEARACLSS